MNSHLAAALALLICTAGVLLIRRDFITGRSQLWLGGKPLDVTRQADSLLFWLATAGKTTLIGGLIAVCVVQMFSR